MKSLNLTLLLLSLIFGFLPQSYGSSQADTRAAGYESLEQVNQEDLKNFLLSLRRQIGITFEAHKITLRELYLPCLKGEFSISSDNCTSLRNFVAHANRQLSRMKIHLALSNPAREVDIYSELIAERAPSYSNIINRDAQHPYRDLVTIDPLTTEEIQRALQLFRSDLQKSREAATTYHLRRFNRMSNFAASDDLTDRILRPQIERSIFELRRERRAEHHQKYVDLISELPIIALLPGPLDLNKPSDLNYLSQVFEKIMKNSDEVWNLVQQLPDNQWQSLLPLMKYKPLLSNELFNFFEPSSELSEEDQTKIIQLLSNRFERDQMIESFQEIGIIVAATLGCGAVMRTGAGLIARGVGGIVGRVAGYLGSSSTAAQTTRALSCGFATGLPINIYFTQKSSSEFQQEMRSFFSSPHGQQMIIEWSRLDSANRDLTLNYLTAALGAGLGPIFKVTVLPRLQGRMSPNAFHFLQKALSIF